MKIAMVQIPMAETIEGNMAEILSAMASAKAQGATVAVFPECAVTGYHPEMGREISPARVQEVIENLATQCRALSIGLVIGGPFYPSSNAFKPWNAALVFDCVGALVAAIPKVIFTDDEVRNDIYVPGTLSDRSSFRLEGRDCATLICIEFAGEVGAFTQSHCERFLDALETKPSVVFVIGVMDLGPDSQAPALAQWASKKYDTTFVVVNASHWGFGVPSGCLGGSLTTSPEGEIVAVAQFNEADIVVVDRS